MEKMTTTSMMQFKCPNSGSYGHWRIVIWKWNIKHKHTPRAIRKTTRRNMINKTIYQLPPSVLDYHWHPLVVSEGWSWVPWIPRTNHRLRRKQAYLSENKLDHKRFTDLSWSNSPLSDSFIVLSSCTGHRNKFHVLNTSHCWN